MIFVRVDSDNKVQAISFFPFDETMGLGKTEEELLEIGKLVDSIPEIKNREGQYGYHVYDEETNSVIVKYAERELNSEEKIKLLEEENEQLKGSIADLWEVVLIGGAE